MDRLSEDDRAIVNTIFNPLQPLGESTADDFLDVTEGTEGTDLSAEVLEIVRRAIICAESKQFEDSFKLFEEALQLAPTSPSIFNDRAQALRLAGRDEEALEDLHRAVELSGGKGRAGVQALCQRGALYRSMNNDEKAREDFSLAAKGGSSFAKSQLVALNPYAAMCNAMLREISLKSECKN